MGEDGKPGPYEWLTYVETRDKAYSFLAGLQKLGFGPKSKIGIYSGNTVEHMLVIKATDAASGVIVPIYDSLGEEAVLHIIHHAELETIAVERRKLALLSKLAGDIKDQVKRAIVIPSEGGEKLPEDVKELDGAKELIEAGIEVVTFDSVIGLGGGPANAQVHPPSPSDMACIMYTSGTTGTPKGVVHTHSSIVAVTAALHNLIKEAHIELDGHDSMLSYLTLAHIFGRVVEELALSVGAAIGYWSGSVKGLMDDLATLKPTLFIAVPRVLERVASTVRKQISKAPLPARLVFHAAFATKRFLLQSGLPAAIAGAGGDQLVFKRMRQAMGGRVRFIVSGGAPLSPAIEDFANVALAPLLQGYGLTETCAASFLIIPGDARLAYTVGPPVSANEFRLESVPELKYSAEDHPPKVTNYLVVALFH